MTENDGSHKLEDIATDKPSPEDQFPGEPFPCPACGQLLAPSCRVCVACHHSIDPAEIRKPQTPVAVETPVEREPEPVRFSWRSFLRVFVIWVVGGTLVQRFMPPLRAQLVLGGVQILCSFWVLFDALQKHLPRPFRWGMGTLLLWPIIFPWYLARRNYPLRPCPFIEARVKPTTIAALFILLAVLVYVMLKYAPPA
jgi:hypothetical protein